MKIVVFFLLVIVVLIGILTWEVLHRKKVENPRDEP